MNILHENNFEDNVTDMADEIVNELLGYIPDYDELEKGLTYVKTRDILIEITEPIRNKIKEKFNLIDCELKYNSDEIDYLTFNIHSYHPIDRLELEEFVISLAGHVKNIDIYNWRASEFLSVDIYSKAIKQLYIKIRKQLTEKLNNIPKRGNDTGVWLAAKETVKDSI